MNTTCIVLACAACLSFLAFVETSPMPLNELYRTLQLRKSRLMERLLDDVIRSTEPKGVEGPEAIMGEYETFKAAPDSHFFHDGNGHMHYRQFRRMNINNVMHHHLF